MKGRLGCRAILTRSQALRLAKIWRLVSSSFFSIKRDLLLEADAEGMGFRVLLQLRKLVLQFHNRLFEVELMFHPS